MPSTGFYLFLPHLYSSGRWTENGVNALNGLLLISSTNKAKEVAKSEGVNALNGLLLISSNLSITKKYDPVCVNAINGLLLISSHLYSSG